MKDKDNGGPAFPIGDMHGEGGMTLLDYFAAAALQSPFMVQAINETPKAEGVSVGQHVASIAYAIAARMIAERK